MDIEGFLVLVYAYLQAFLAWQHLHRPQREQAEVVPITLESLASEWMHDWKNPKSGELVKEVHSKYGAMIGMS
ncbi:MAG TPA: hypothetical protein VN455_13995 [Methanotrichaceae archaeon]|nr:hypothetical protein [Methanotrichaceae archaeon]